MYITDIIMKLTKLDMHLQNFIYTYQWYIYRARGVNYIRAGESESGVCLFLEAQSREWVKKSFKFPTPDSLKK